MSPLEPPGIMPKHGGYRRLRTYIQSQVIYEATIRFCERYVNRKDRTFDQMVQAARSGVQNIVEGSVDSGTSKKIEFKLTGIARGSLEELYRDYCNHLFRHRLPLWPDDDPRRKRVASSRIDTLDDLHNLLADAAPWQAEAEERCANAMTALIRMTCFLLDRQLARLERDFLTEGGITERLYRTRKR